MVKTSDWVLWKGIFMRKNKNQQQFFLFGWFEMELLKKRPFKKSKISHK
jgi:hypothetical protein